jgi:hypothetical protein
MGCITRPTAILKVRMRHVKKKSDTTNRVFPHKNDLLIELPRRSMTRGHFQASLRRECNCLHLSCKVTSVGPPDTLEAALQETSILCRR